MALIGVTEANADEEAHHGQSLHFLGEGGAHAEAAGEEAGGEVASAPPVVVRKDSPAVGA